MSSKVKFKTQSNKWANFPHSHYEDTSNKLYKKYLENYLTHEFTNDSDRCFNCGWKWFEFMILYVPSCSEFIMEQVLK